MRGVTTMQVEDAARDCRELSSDLSAFPGDARDHHAVVGRRLVTHPGDDRRLGALGDRNPFRSGDRPATDRCRMGGHLSSDRAREVGPLRSESQECEHFHLERSHVGGLCVLTSGGRCRTLLRVTHRRALRLERGSRGSDVLARRP